MTETFNQTERIYLQIKRGVEDDILAGIILEGEPVPSVNHFCKFYSVNPATVSKGIALLVADGVLVKNRGVGMFVTEGSRERLLERRKSEFKANFVDPLVGEAAKLGISRADLIAAVAAGIK